MKSVHLSKATRALLAGMMTCGLALTAVTSMQQTPMQPVSAETITATETKVTLHKLGMLDTELIDNKGDQLTSLPTGAILLRNAGFTAFDITEAFWQLKNGDWKAKTNDELMQYLSSNWDTLKADFLSSEAATQVGQQQVTQANGMVSWDKLPVRSGKKFRIYLFEETQPVAKYMKALPTILGLPTAKLGRGSEVKSEYHFYPKNSTIDKSLMTGGG